MIWHPQTVMARSEPLVAFEVTGKLYGYLLRVAHGKLLTNDPPWPTEFGSAPTLDDDGEYFCFGFERVNLGDWLIANGGSRLIIIGAKTFDKFYLKLE